MSSGEVERLEAVVTADVTQYNRNIRSARQEAGGFNAELRRTKAAGAAARAGITDQLADLKRLSAQLETTTRRQRELEAQQSRTAGGMGGVAARAAVVGLALNRLGANLSQLSENDGAWTSRAGGLLQSLTSGDIVGAVRAAGAASELTEKQVAQLGQSLTAAEIAALGSIPGFDKYIAKLKEIRAEAYATGGAVAAMAIDSRGGPRGPGGIAAETSGVAGPKGTLGLPQQLQTALALAQASPGTKDDLAQARRAKSFLERQLGTLKNDAAQESVASDLAQINSLIEQLTRKKDPKDPKAKPILPANLELGIAQAGLTQTIADDLRALHAAESYLERRIRIEKNIDRKVQEVERLGEIRSQIAALAGKKADASAVLGPLFGGPFVNSSNFKFAEGFGYEARPRDLLKDIQESIRVEKQRQRDIATIRKKGGSAALAAELASDPSNAQQVHALAGAGSGLIHQYESAFEKRQKVAEQTVKLQEMTVTADTVVIHAGSVTSGNPLQRRTSGLKGTRGVL